MIMKRSARPSSRLGGSGTDGQRKRRLALTWILLETNTSLTSDAIRLDFPVPSSPHTHMRTGGQESVTEESCGERLGGRTCRHGS